MPVVINIKVNNIPNYAGLSDALKHPTEMLNKLSQFRRSAFFANIATGIDASGNPVAPLSEPYRTYKERKYGKRAIRVASGKMQSTYDSVVSSDRLTESISSNYAQYHQQGTRKMPQRKLLPESWEDLSAKEQAAIERLLKEQLDIIVTKYAQSIR